MSHLNDDVTSLLSVTHLDAEQVFAEAQMSHLDFAPETDLDSFCQGFALAAFVYGTDADDDGSGTPTDLPLLTGAA